MPISSRRRHTVRLPLLSLALLCVFATPAALAAQHVEGTTGEGALYVFDVPDAWNGDLIVYAHGIVDPGAPIAAPTTQDDFNLLRDAWLGLHDAVASSSYAENGYAVKDGVQHTHQLRGLFTSKFGRPRRVYLAGHSLGAVIDQMLVERYPGQYDGVLLLCGFLGGADAEVAYLTDARVLFDYFFPGVLPGDAFHVPPGLVFEPGSPTFLAVLGALQAGFVAPGQPTLQYARTARLQAGNAEEIVFAALTAIGFNIRFVDDVLSRTHERIFYDNTGTTYSGSADDATLNARVGRFASTPDAARYLETYYTPTGALKTPTLTLHTTLDPTNPFFHETAYAGIVSRAGASEFLVQQWINRFGHCAFTIDEVLGSFLDLRNWVENGVRPAGGEAGEPLP